MKLIHRKKKKFFSFPMDPTRCSCESPSCFEMPRRREIRNTIPISNGGRSPIPSVVLFVTDLLVEFALVEGELLALQNVSIAATGLAGSAGNDGVEATGLELLLDGGLDLAGGGEAGGLLLLDGVGLLDVLLDLALLGGLGLLASSAKGLAVVGLVPLAEGGGVDLDDGRLGQGVCADQLVVGGVVGHGDDAGLAGAALGAPGEVAGIEAEGAVLVVAAAGADGVHALCADAGVGALATGLESALLPC